MPTESDAIALLEELGITEYEARCFVALSRVGTATATEISDLSGVPRSRVYDSVGRLHDRGLVDVQQSEPREYQALSPERAIETLREQRESVLEDASEALDRLERVDSPEESGAWAISESDHVADRIETLVDDGEESVYVLIVDDEFARRSFPAVLADASERGLTVTVEVPTDELATRFEDAVPGATVEVTEDATRQAAVNGKWLGGILMVDEESVLIGAMQSTPRPGDPDETAIWASGSDHGLVVGLKHLLRDRIGRLSPLAAD